MASSSFAGLTQPLDSSTSSPANQFVVGLHSQSPESPTNPQELPGQDPNLPEPPADDPDRDLPDVQDPGQQPPMRAPIG